LLTGQIHPLLQIDCEKSWVVAACKRKENVVELAAFPGLTDKASVGGRPQAAGSTT
jgi:hypothetical protein